ncbi:modulator of macroautophagy TMEM150B-like [Branchiostoma floridae]|uniref:Modulator of macroautophagy TMEM150B-like n=2 Tax=Branchiostoma floridae TaxID=7739 RepID=A0A9J7LXX3_BRAFL|nr:modulator of macroautophagy TMEM150B-like [Branchiostoma floridae]
MEYSRYCLSPLFLVFGVIAMWFVCLGLTIGLGHKTSAVFISDTGAYHPEQGIFTMTLNIGAVGIAMTQVLHYRYVTQFGGPTRLNMATLIVGLLAALGLSMVGAFQWNEMFVVHLIGASMAFLLGTAYAWLQTVLSYKLRDTGTTMGTFGLRLFLAIVVTGTLVPFAVTLGLVFTDTVRTPAMLTATVTLEWILGISLLTYLATLAWELRKVTTVVISLDIEGLFDLQKTERLRTVAVIPGNISMEAV